MVLMMFLSLPPFKIIDVTDEESQQAGINWWEEMTARGGEGMVVKPWILLPKEDVAWRNRQ